MATTMCAKLGAINHTQQVKARVNAFKASPVRCSAVAPLDAGKALNRRQLLQYSGLLGLGLVATPPALAKGPGGFNPVKDAQDGYSFLYPFGWQEVSVRGQDVVYKDIIEPLESVSVSLTPTDKASITEFGDLAEVCLTLADEVLTSPQQEVKLLGATEKTSNGRTYYEFEFAAKSPTYIRHAVAAVTVANGQFYTITTGANEKRWDKVKNKLQVVVNSFEVVDRF